MNIITKWLVLLIGILLLIDNILVTIPYNWVIVSILVIIIGIVELVKKE